MKRLIVALLFMFIAGTVSAQEEPPRRIYTVLAYGEGIFDSEDWLATAYELPVNTVAYWSSDRYSAVAYLELLHYSAGFTVQQAVDLFNDFDTWLTQTFVNYVPWEVTTSCGVGDTMLFQLDGVSNGLPYKIRYWFQPISADTLYTFQLIFPADNPTMMDDYAARLFPDLVSCERR